MVLLERARELGEIAGALDRLGRGQGGLVLVEGAAGIGKTALLDAACALAAGTGATTTTTTATATATTATAADRALPAGAGTDATTTTAVRVLRAAAGELEQDFPYGVVRQLFEPPLRAADPGERRALLGGRAEPAAPIVAPHGESEGEGTSEGAGSGAIRAPARSPAGDAYIVLHGLYWLTVNLAAAGPGPLLLVVDDVHWADSPSLRFLLYLARRLPGLPVLVVLAARPEEPEPGESVLARLAVEGARVLRPASLSPVAVADLVDRTFGEHPAERFVAACHAATAGNPFLVREMATALASDGVRPVAETAEQVGRFGPATVARSTMLRLAKLPDAALPLARAVAVLGADARLDRTARLAHLLGAPGLSEDAVLEAVEALVRIGILGPGRPLAFVHPIVRAAIHQDMSATARSAAHARAAQLLAHAGDAGADGQGTDVDVDAIAGHLLLTEPRASATVVERLRAAARHAEDRGAPGNAAVYLRRALDEAAPATPRAELVHELAMAEKLGRDPRALDRLHEALELAPDPATRAEIVCELSEALAAAGRWEPAMEILEANLPRPGEGEGGGQGQAARSLRMETQYATGAAWDPCRVAEFERRSPRLRGLVDAGGAPARRLTLVLAAIGSMRGDADGRVLDLARRGLDGGRYLVDDGPDSLALQLAGSAFVNTEQLDEALDLAEAMVATARARGSAYGFVNGVLLRARASTRAGNLVATEADLRTALEVAQEHDLVLGVSSILLYGADAWTERDELADLAAMARGLPLPPALAATPIGLVVAAARGRARLLAGDTEGAADDLRSVGEIAEAVRFRNPNALCWRSPLALALAHDAPAEACRLAEDELAEARKVDQPRAIGVALRTLGVLAAAEPGREAAGLERLREAVTVLDAAPAGLEQARARIELGAALRRGNQRTAARTPLREGLDLAHRLGATRLAERAAVELAASGARTRRRALVGADALTPSERRIADMAGAGMSNTEIAQALFVTLNTVETHLRRVFRKLDIKSRTQLPDAMATPTPDP